ncbi:MAG: zinc-binding alcohol dehydrogenase [Chlorobiales bacterium]|nr:zinc-binding alcohol dehydrogenase [Chlorobiales bacterium]
MQNKATAIVYPKANKVVMMEVEHQPMGPSDVLVKTIATSVTPGLERMQITGKSVTRKVIKFPALPGSEMIGEVIGVGEFVRGIEIGEFVYVSKGDKWLNVDSLFGCQADRVLTDFHNVLPLGSTPLNHSLLIGLLAYVISGIKKLDLKPEQNILVLGIGSVGMMVIEYLKYKGFLSVDAVETFSIRAKLSSARNIALQIEDFTEEFYDQYDVVIEATGRLLLIEQAVRLLKPQGKILLLGNYEVTKYDYRLIQEKEPVLISSSITKDADLVQAKRILSDESFPADKFITHVFPSHDYNRGLETALNASDAIKTVLTWR